MSTLALMRFLEASPDRYDRAMAWLTLGRVLRLHEAVSEAAASAAEPGKPARVLEIGCGTGAVTARLASRGARITALDQNPEMLSRAQERLANAEPPVRWLERTASEIDGLAEASFDAVVASLSLSEMSRSERSFVLCQARERLRGGGVLVVADEVSPRRPWARAVQRLTWAPQALLAWLLVGTVSRPIEDLTGEVTAAGFAVRSERRLLAGSLAVLVAERTP